MISNTIMTDLAPSPRSIVSPPGRLGLQEHYIDGRFFPSVSGAMFETLNPATNEVLGPRGGRRGGGRRLPPWRRPGARSTRVHGHG